MTCCQTAAGTNSSTTARVPMTWSLGDVLFKYADSKRLNVFLTNNTKIRWTRKNCLTRLEQLNEEKWLWPQVQKACGDFKNRKPKGLQLQGIFENYSKRDVVVSTYTSIAQWELRKWESSSGPAFPTGAFPVPIKPNKQLKIIVRHYTHTHILLEETFVVFWS